MRQEAPIAPTPKKPAAKKPAAKTVKKAVTKKTAVKKPAAKAVKKAAVKKTAVKKEAVKKAAPKKVAAPQAATKPAVKTTTKAATSGHVLFDLVMEALSKEKGENLVSIDLSGKSAIADYMVIVSGTSSRHVGAMAEKIKQKIGTAGYRCRIEGKGTGDWVIVDAGDVIVHLFRPEVRAFYNLEKLWMSDFSTVGYNLYTSQ